MSDPDRDSDKRAAETPAPPRPKFTLQRKCACGGGASALTGSCDGCEKKKLQRSAMAPAPREVPDSVGDVLATPGTPLDGRPRREMESRFGHDFGSVRIHTDAAAAESARGVGALAYTAGSHVVFGAGQYAPSTQAGRHLLAHELTHTIQQRSRSRLQRQEDGAVSSPADAAEVEADRTADAVTGTGDYLVEDDALPGAGQMRKTEFLDELQRSSCLAADAELARVGRSTEGCPYVERAFARYRTMAAGRVERSIRRYIEAAGVTAASDYIPLVTRRVAQGVAQWATTGDMSGVPDELAGDAMGGGGVLGMLGGGLGGGLLGGIGSLFFKRAAAGSATPGEAAMAAASLGRGAPLESGVRGRMEGAFGHDFSTVRVHSGGTAANASSSLGARAFTLGGDIAFGAGEYQPNTLVGDALIAHELAHVVQQSGAGGGGGGSDVEDDADHSAIGAVMSVWGGAKQLGRNAMPRLRSGLRLQRCSKKKPAAPPQVKHPLQPTTAPTTTPAEPAIVDKVRSTAAVCDGVANPRACQHEAYVNTVLPRTIKNIRAVRTPYTDAIASLYEAALPVAQKAAPPPEGLGTSQAPAAGPVTVTFAGTTFTFTKFQIDLQNVQGGVNGQAFSAGTAIAFVTLNEGSNDALFGDLPPIEETMVHEMIHVFNAIVTKQNEERATGTAAHDANLDDATYADVEKRLRKALLPLVKDIELLPGFATSKPFASDLSTKLTASSFISETIARVEAGIYVKKRAGGTFGTADIPAVLTQIYNANYWNPRPPNLTELSDWVKAHKADIDTAILPLAQEAGEIYLRERPQ